MIATPGRLLTPLIAAATAALIVLAPATAAAERHATHRLVPGCHKHKPAKRLGCRHARRRCTRKRRGQRCTMRHLPPIRMTAAGITTPGPAQSANAQLTAPQEPQA